MPSINLGSTEIFRERWESNPGVRSSNATSMLVPHHGIVHDQQSDYMLQLAEMLLNGIILTREGIKFIACCSWCPCTWGCGGRRQTRWTSGRSAGTGCSRTCPSEAAAAGPKSCRRPRCASEPPWRPSAPRWTPRASSSSRPSCREPGKIVKQDQLCHKPSYQ